MNDLLHRRRQADGFLDSVWFWQHADIEYGHLKRLNELYRLDESHQDENISYQPLDMWALHPNVMVFQGRWCFNHSQEHLHTVALSILTKPALELPYVVFPDSTEQGEVSLDWRHRPISCGWSPLRWWFANREEQALTFTNACSRHLDEGDWLMAGIDIQSIEHSVMSNLLRLSHRGRPMPLQDDAFRTQYEF